MPLQHGTNIRLPDYKQLRSEFSRGATLSQLGKKYGTDARSINRKMKEMSAHFGDPWPIVRYGSEEWLRRVTKANQAKNERELVNPVVIRDYVKAWLAHSGMSQREFSRQCGVSFSCMNNLIHGHRKYLGRDAARKINAALDRLGVFDAVGVA